MQVLRTADAQSGIKGGGASVAGEQLHKRTSLPPSVEHLKEADHPRPKPPAVPPQQQDWQQLQQHLSQQTMGMGVHMSLLPSKSGGAQLKHSCPAQSGSLSALLSATAADRQQGPPEAPREKQRVVTNGVQSQGVQEERLYPAVSLSHSQVRL